MILNISAKLRGGSQINGTSGDPGTRPWRQESRFPVSRSVDGKWRQDGETYADHRSKYIEKVTDGQLVDGLDSFYADSRNRRIWLTDAVWLVVNAITGTPQEKLNLMLENWRHNPR